MKLCKDVINIITSFLDNMQDILSLKHLNTYYNSHTYSVNFYVERLYNNLQTPYLNMTKYPFDLSISGNSIRVLHADRLITDADFIYMPNIEELHCRYAKLTDLAFRYLHNIKHLYCDHCYGFTDNALINKNILTLDCGYWISNFTDTGLLSIKNTITRLYCRYNTKFSDKSLGQLKNLEVLYMGNNENFSDLSVQKLRKLNILYCGKNTKITDMSLLNMQNLTILSFDKNTNFTDYALVCAQNLKVLFIYYNNNITDLGISYLRNLLILSCKQNNKITSNCLKYLTFLRDLSCSFELPPFQELQISNPDLKYINTTEPRSLDILCD
jgi:hypothetical protein